MTGYLLGVLLDFDVSTFVDTLTFTTSNDLSLSSCFILLLHFSGTGIHVLRLSMRNREQHTTTSRRLIVVTGHLRDRIRMRNSNNMGIDLVFYWFCYLFASTSFIPPGSCRISVRLQVVRLLYSLVYYTIRLIMSSL